MSTESKAPGAAPFKFGENWQRFMDSSFDQGRVDISQDHMLKLLRRKDLDGVVFLDIGCGSGIHSLAALQAGAKRVISFDYDPASVAASRALRSKVGEPDNWEVLSGSVLDETFMRRLDKVDIVYSWGVLHHTGDMWPAIANAAIPLKDDGVFYIALYAHEVYQNPSPEFWIDIKLRYNQGTAEEKSALEEWYAWERVLKPRALAGENPFTIISEYKKSRGMEFWTDVRDWLGGYPIEFSRVRDVVRFGHDELALEMLDLKSGEGNTEYLFRRRGAGPHYWDVFSFEERELARPFAHENGFCFAKRIPELETLSDTGDEPNRSPVMVFEDGVLVGFPHARHDHIRTKGEGRYSHWGDALLFSASDNSDPNQNGRRYSIRIR